MTRHRGLNTFVLMPVVVTSANKVVTGRSNAEAHELEREIATVEGKNEESARLLARQQALVADGQRFLAEFERRRASIVDGLARLTRTPLPT